MRSASTQFLIRARRGLVADALPVAPRVGAQRMREDGGAVRLAERDVVDAGTALGLEAGLLAHALGDLVIRACGVAADADAADADAPLVEGQSAAEHDRSPAYLAVSLAVVFGLPGAQRVER